MAATIVRACAPANKKRLSFQRWKRHAEDNAVTIKDTRSARAETLLATRKRPPSKVSCNTSANTSAVSISTSNACHRSLRWSTASICSTSTNSMRDATHSARWPWIKSIDLLKDSMHTYTSRNRSLSLNHFRMPQRKALWASWAAHAVNTTNSLKRSTSAGTGAANAPNDAAFIACHWRHKRSCAVSPHRS